MRKAILFLIVCMVPAAMIFAGNDDKTSNDGNSSIPFVLKKGRGRRSHSGIGGMHMITIGVAFDGAAAKLANNYPASRFWIDSLRTGHNAGYSVSQVTQTPMVNLMMDFGIADQVSMGFAFGYQSMAVTWGGTYVPEQDVYTRIGAALRFDYHFITEENMLLYAGIRAGYNYSIMTSTFTRWDANYPKNFDGGPSKLAAQAHLGFSYYFGVVGANVEAAYSYDDTYYAAAGLSFKF
ncbi:MAG TPA: hypothetical protein VGO45_12915 [Bacteroidia bacterium]|jgi:hypothetical protein|nr:hypothetical protein [Bacteroidia bacterium]